MWCCLARSMNMSFPKRRWVWGIKSQAVKQRKILQKRRKGALRSRQEQVANEILMYFRSQRKLQGEVSLSDSLDGEGEGGSLSILDTIRVDDTMLEDLDARDSCARVRQCVARCLDEREAMVIDLRYGLSREQPLTQREIAAKCGISRSYVSRIEKRALEKLRAAMETGA
ncbi:hypothetical protein B5E80_13590 [Flavonifractor sp. An135]|nr:hypothetical protein B5E80_13590 [Flavonifractor sp. An135]